MESAKIQISIRLLEKLAGVKREAQPPQQRRQQQLPGSLPGPPLARLLALPGDLPPTFALEPEVRGALATSRRVGALLLKAEEGEMEAVAAAADDLIKREYSAPVRQVPCQAQRDACVGCYQQHKQDAWQCAGLVDAYAACSAAAYGSLSS